MDSMAPFRVEVRFFDGGPGTEEEFVQGFTGALLRWRNLPMKRRHNKEMSNKHKSFSLLLIY